MAIYFSFVSLSLLFFSFSYYQYTEKENALGVSYKEPTPILFGIGCLTLILLFAFRGRTGTDTSRYNRIFLEIGEKSLLESASLSQDRGLYILNWITYHISSGNLLFNNVVVGCIAYIPVFVVFKKYSSNYVLAILFYIITGAYFFAYNGQKEGLAIAITFAGFSFLAKKKYVSYTLLIILASLFHSTAIIILPFGLMISRKTESKVFIFFCVAVLLSTVFLWRLWNTVFQILDILGRDRIVDSYSDLSEQLASGTGVNTLRILVTVIPTILGILYYQQLQEKNKYFYIILNFNIISSLLMIAASKTWYIARLAYYFNIATPLLLLELPDIVSENSRTLFNFLIICLFLVYIWFSLHMESHLLPYYFTIGDFVRVFN